MKNNPRSRTNAILRIDKGTGAQSHGKPLNEGGKSPKSHALVIPVISLSVDHSTIEAVLVVIRRLIANPNGLVAQTKGQTHNKTHNHSTLRRDGQRSKPTNPSNPGHGRWPLDMLQASGGGIMALRVQPGAGLEPYGISDLDVLLISFDDPTPGEPAMVAIDGKVVFGWFTRKGRRVRIEPLAGDAPLVETDARKIQVACALKGIVRWLRAERPTAVRKESKTDSNRVHPAS